MNNLKKNKAISLFKFLQEVIRLKNPIVREIENYDKVLWFKNIPKETECWLISEQEEESNSDIWLEVKKPNLKSFPELPETLKAWINEAELTNSQQLPQIKDSIAIKTIEQTFKTNEINEDLNTQKIQLLTDSPDIKEEWNNYLNNWQVWAKENNRLHKIQNVYSTLHLMYQELKKRGESREVVLGIGLLSWKTATGQRISRHLLTLQANIELEGKNGIIKVRASGENYKTLLEQDMLETSSCPNLDDQILIEKKVEELCEDIWNTEKVKDILSTWVHVVSPNGKFIEETLETDPNSQDPTISLSPALILRRRNEKNFIKTIQTIINQVETSSEIPAGIERVIDIIDDKDSDFCEENSGETYLPLPYNDEQLLILNNLYKRQGVLVQGPPGTGKSHTIANLICHLLATGKKVLITSQTPRALSVLKNKIPPEIRSLCVSLLGNNSSALKELQDSVQGITDKQYNWDLNKVLTQIEIEKEKLNSLKDKEHEIFAELNSLWELEKEKHSICEQKYEGTVQEIAKEIFNTREKHNWLSEDISVETTAPLHNNEIMELLKLCINLKNEEVNLLKLKPLLSLKFPSIEDFETLIEEEKKFSNALYNTNKETNNNHFKLKDLTLEDLNSFKKSIEAIDEIKNKIKSKDQTTYKKLLEIYPTNNINQWEFLLITSRKYLENLLEFAKEANDFTIDLPEKKSIPEKINEVMYDAELLLEYFKTNTGLGLPGFRPKPVSNSWYLIKETRINGRPADSTEALNELLLGLKTNESLYKLSNLWKPLIGSINGNKVLQTIHLNEITSILELLLECDKELTSLKNTFPELDINITEDNTINNLKILVEEATNLNITAAEINKIELLKRNIKELSINNELIKDLLTALELKDKELYLNSLIKIEDINEKTKLLERKNTLLTQLSTLAPNLANTLKTIPSEQDLEEKLSDFETSWNWLRAYNWVKDFIKRTSHEKYIIDLEYIQNEIKFSITQLSSSLSWKYCFERLGEDERQHLRAWVQEIRTIGAGTGKHALRHRKVAMEHMEYCKNAIPAWIMPLYKVAENLNPSPNMFDVVIIDEASQSGPESLLMLYLAKKIIVVGDDEQISPDNIGINHDDYFLLHEKYLKDLPESHKSALGPQSSLFDLADILFGGRIILQEHFRCMPEIIKFSNDLCYTHKPLKPLKQFPTNRLEPIKPFYLVEGNREILNNKSTNKTEAEAIVKSISECCRNPAYDGKSMGVISLLGENQSQYIAELLLKEIGSQEIENRNLICGDAYAFQGDERDLIFLSLVASPGETKLRALTSKPFKQRFNVATSRACEQIWLFHSITLSDISNKECLRYKLIDHFYNKRETSKISEDEMLDLINQVKLSKNDLAPPPPFKNWFEADLFIKVAGLGYKIIPYYEVADYKINFVIEGLENKVAINLIGDLDLDSTINKNVKAQSILKRCGWMFTEVKGSEFYLDPEIIISRLVNELEKVNIKPISENFRNIENSSKLDLSSYDVNVEIDYTVPSKESELMEIDIQKIEEAIIKTLENNSCLNNAITSEVCRYLRIKLKGKDKQLFNKRVRRVINLLKQQEIVLESADTDSLTLKITN